MSTVLLSTEIQIDPEFHAMIPPLTPAEYQQLEANLIMDGCSDPLVVWNGLLLDGHNRKIICESKGITYSRTEVDLPDRQAAQTWIIRNQFGRRNLQPYQRAELALKLEPLIAAKAKDNQRCGQGGILLSQNSAEAKPVDTRAELAKISGLSHDTIRKAKIISEQAPEDVKTKLRCGHPGLSINKTYTAIVRQQRDDARKALLFAPVNVKELLQLAPGQDGERQVQVERSGANRWTVWLGPNLAGLELKKNRAAVCAGPEFVKHQARITEKRDRAKSLREEVEKLTRQARKLERQVEALERDMKEKVTAELTRRHGPAFPGTDGTEFEVSTELDADLSRLVARQAAEILLAQGPAIKVSSYMHRWPRNEQGGVA